MTLELTPARRFTSLFLKKPPFVPWFVTLIRVDAGGSLIILAESGSSAFR